MCAGLHFFTKLPRVNHMNFIRGLPLRVLFQSTYLTKAIDPSGVERGWIMPSMRKVPYQKSISVHKFWKKIGGASFFHIKNEAISKIIDTSELLCHHWFSLTNISLKLVDRFIDLILKAQKCFSYSMHSQLSNRNIGIFEEKYFVISRFHRQYI